MKLGGHGLPMPRAVNSSYTNYYEYTSAKQNGGGAEWVELFITLTKGMGKPTYEVLLSLIASWPSRLVQRVQDRRLFAGLETPEYSGL